jgi:Sir2 family
MTIESESKLIARARTWVNAAQRVVVLTGAGISTDSGIPDFRGPHGAWTKNPNAEAQSTLQHYLDDPKVRAAVWQERLHSPVWMAQPNSGHFALVALERRGKLHALITQNIDELHYASRDVLGLRCAHADAIRAGARARRRGRPGMFSLRRHIKERHNFIRPDACARSD